jgi:hypothetical protein
MNRNHKFAAAGLLSVVLAAVIWMGCDHKTPRGVHFSGTVVSNAGKPVDAAEVRVGGATAKTDGRGFFKLAAAPDKASRYVLNIRKSGFGLVSRIYDRGIRNGKWTMTQGTTHLVDPRQPIRVRDAAAAVRSNCQGRLSGRIDWSRYPEQRIPRIFDGGGRPVPGELPSELREALRLLEGGTECGPGISVSIPPNSLVAGSGRTPSGMVEVTVSTVDLYAPDSMPGDLSVETGGRASYMQSYGAGTVSITAGGKPIELAKGARAEVTIPIDPAQLKSKTPIQPTIPFLRYDETRGFWDLVGTARVNAKGDAYIAEVDHLSTFNADLVKTDQACVRIDSSAIQESYTLEVTIPMGGGAAPSVRSHLFSPDPDHPENPNIHAVYNLPSNTWIMLVPIRDAQSDNPVPLGTFVVNTGGPQDPGTPNMPEWDYGACRSRAILEEIQPGAQYVVDAAGRNFGPLPAITYALADEATGLDVYPTGSGERFLFGLFDTGSTKVRIYNETPYDFRTPGDPNSGLDCATPNPLTDANFFDSDADLLGLTAATTVRLRLNGLSAINSITLDPPIGQAGTDDAPQIELTGIIARPEPHPTDLAQKKVDVTLIGAPAIRQAAVKIDYTQKIEKSGYRDRFYPGMAPGNSRIDNFQEFDTVWGPDIIFYAPNDPLIPFPDLFLELGRWGLPEPLYCLKKVTFKTDSTEFSDQDLPANKFFLYDTGARITIVNTDIAAALGLTPGNGTFDVWAAEDKKGYVLAEVIMTGSNGSYTVTNASVACDWDRNQIISPGVVYAVIGANFFDQVPILFDPARNRLGIGPPAAAPVTWPAIPRNCGR